MLIIVIYIWLFSFYFIVDIVSVFFHFSFLERFSLVYKFVQPHCEIHVIHSKLFKWREAWRKEIWFLSRLFSWIILLYCPFGLDYWTMNCPLLYCLCKLIHFFMWVLSSSQSRLLELKLKSSLDVHNATS
jgi:hypothetical protein